MIKKILLALAALVGAFIVVAALQPASYRVERSITISAPAAEIFPQVNDLQKAHIWSPWMKFDPNVKVAFSAMSAGVGASSTWDGNNQIGAGRQTIVESRANERVRIRLDFTKPFESTANTEFALHEHGSQTTVTWSMDGKNGFICKAVCLFLDQDEMIGTPFEQGLASLKTLVEEKRDAQTIASVR